MVCKTNMKELVKDEADEMNWIAVSNDRMMLMS